MILGFEDRYEYHIVDDTILCVDSSGRLTYAANTTMQRYTVHTGVSEIIILRSFKSPPGIVPFLGE